MANGNACSPPEITKSSPTERGRCTKCSEDQLDRKLKLPLSLVRFIDAELAGVIQVAVRAEVVNVIQDVVCLNPKLDVKVFTDEARRDVLEKRSVPEFLSLTAKNVAAQGAELRAARVIGKDWSRRRAKGRGV